MACPAPQVPPIPSPARARAATSQTTLGASPHRALPSEKATIDTAREARRPIRSLIQPKSSPPAPVIPTPTAVSSARSPSDRPKVSCNACRTNEKSISE